jgi:hypothetical protein
VNVIKVLYWSVYGGEDLVCVDQKRGFAESKSDRYLEYNKRKGAEKTVQLFLSSINAVV